MTEWLAEHLASIKSTAPRALSFHVKKASMPCKMFMVAAWNYKLPFLKYTEQGIMLKVVLKQDTQLHYKSLGHNEMHNPHRDYPSSSANKEGHQFKNP